MSGLVEGTSWTVLNEPRHLRSIQRRIVQTSADRGASLDALDIVLRDVGEVLHELACKLTAGATIEVAIEPQRPDELGITVRVIPTGWGEDGVTCSIDFTADPT